MHVYGIQKNNNNPVCETAKETQVYRTVFWTLWWGGMIWENGIKTCIISYKKRIASPGSMQDTGSLGLVHWDDPEGWYREGGGRGDQDGGTCTHMAESYQSIAKTTLQHCKVISLRLK